MRAFVDETAFAHLNGLIEGRMVAAHAPVVFGPDGSVRFHLARGNDLTAMPDGASVLAHVVGTHFYVSPDWYQTEEQVPTWNYRLVEIEGVARRLDTRELRDQIDRLSAVHETHLLPKPVWTSAKMDPRRLDAMMRGIVGFAIERPTLRGTIKMGQTKSAAERANVMDALRARGDDRAADAMAAAR